MNGTLPDPDRKRQWNDRSEGEKLAEANLAESTTTTENAGPSEIL